MSLNHINRKAGVSLAIATLDASSEPLSAEALAPSTGLRITSPPDANALWSAAQNARATVHALSVVQTSLNQGLATVGVAVAAGRMIANLLNKMRETTAAAVTSSPGAVLARAQDFADLRDEISRVVASSTYQGVNMIANGGSAVTALASAMGDETIKVPAAPLYLGSAAIAVGVDDGFANRAEASAMLNTIDAAIANVDEALAALQAGAGALIAELSFVQLQSSTLTLGVGNLVDADAPSVTAQLTALKARQELGVQALAIANSKSANLLNLFAGAGRMVSDA